LNRTDIYIYIHKYSASILETKSAFVVLYCYDASKKNSNNSAAVMYNNIDEVVNHVIAIGRLQFIIVKKIL